LTGIAVNECRWLWCVLWGERRMRSMHVCA